MIKETMANPPLIEIRIDTVGVVPAEVAGEILEEVARAFDRHAKAGGRRDLRLGVKRVDVGSLIVQLAVLGPAQVSAETWVAQGFVEATVHLLLVSQGLASGVVKRGDVRLVEALRTPVSSGVADRVSLTALSTGVKAIVDGDTVARLREVGSRTLRRPPSARKPAAIEEGGRVPARRELAGDIGTVLDVKGRWYVRLEGQEGVLNPLDPVPGVMVEDDALYQFEGSWEGRSYVVRTAVRIG